MDRSFIADIRRITGERRDSVRRRSIGGAIGFGLGIASCASGGATGNAAMWRGSSDGADDAASALDRLRRGKEVFTAHPE